MYSNGELEIGREEVSHLVYIGIMGSPSDFFQVWATWVVSQGSATKSKEHQHSDLRQGHAVASRVLSLSFDSERTNQHDNEDNERVTVSGTKVKGTVSSSVILEVG